MQHPATPRAIAGSSSCGFRGAQAELAEVRRREPTALLVRTRLDVKWFLRELFLSSWFYSPACYRTRLSSPVEFVVGAIRTLGAHWAATELTGKIVNLGQRLYAAPNVKGWDGEKRWINSASWAARLEFANELAGLDNGNALGNNLNLAKIVPTELNDPDAVVNTLAETLLAGDLAAEARSDLVELLVTKDDDENDDDDNKAANPPQKGGDTEFRENEDVRKQRTRRALGILLALPEYHTY